MADARTAQVQITYATQQLHYPVWGMSPSSTPDDTGEYGGYGVEGLAFLYYRHLLPVSRFLSHARIARL